MIVNQRSALVEYIARKSLICLILTFLVNLLMNLLKITSFLGDRSDVSRVLQYEPALADVQLAKLFSVSFRRSRHFLKS